MHLTNNNNINKKTDDFIRSILDNSNQELKLNSTINWKAYSLTTDDFIRSILDNRNQELKLMEGIIFNFSGTNHTQTHESDRR